jgi:hypothetical protein
LKKLARAARSRGDLSSNWSAPNDDTQGLMPPDPSAVRYIASQKIASVGAPGGTAPLTGLMPGTALASVRPSRPTA